MFNKFQNWLKSLPTPEEFQYNSFSYKMVKIAKVGNATIVVRKCGKEWQKTQDYIVENNIYADWQNIEERMCLMPNHHSVYFELMMDDKYSKRIGLSGNIVDFSKGVDEGIEEYLKTVLIPRVEKKLDYYNSRFNK